IVIRRANQADLPPPTGAVFQKCLDTPIAELHLLAEHQTREQLRQREVVATDFAGLRWQHPPRQKKRQTHHLPRRFAGDHPVSSTFTMHRALPHKRRTFTGSRQSRTDFDSFKYGYDKGSNRLFKENINSGAGAFSELYHSNGAGNGYDDFDRLTEFRRGTLSDTNSDGVPDTVSTTTRQQAWTLDALGNWSSLQTNGGTAVNRTHNAQNQVTANGGGSLTYDNNGNLKTGSGSGNTYDAWNRLYAVGVANGRYFLYDALGRRIHEFSQSDGIEYGAGGPYQRTHLYYSTGWQVLEEDSTNQALDKFTQVQNVWSPLYIDALVLRDTEINEAGGGAERPAGPTPTGEELEKRLEALRNDPRFAFAAGVPLPTGVQPETRTGPTRTGGLIDPAPMNVPTVAGRIYVEQDANWNVTSITDTSGGVLERYVYDPYGTSTRLTSVWGTAGADTYVMSNRHQGGRQDAATGHLHFRHRDLDTLLGRWVQQDPAGYVDSNSLFEFVRSNPASSLDPSGLGVYVPEPPKPLPTWVNPSGMPLPPYRPYNSPPLGPTIGPDDRDNPPGSPQPPVDYDVLPPGTGDLVTKQVCKFGFQKGLSLITAIGSDISGAIGYILFNPSKCGNSDTITGPHAPPAEDSPTTQPAPKDG
ncbi:MAG TPA: RHS repeat-associated core domain-containing protein, partial [Planctomycetota bacterium]|nr:RHS repeat-associated core domain-containing protein [Planctomycetota bacterium]